MNKINILFISSIAKIAGGEQSLLQLVLNLPRASYNPTVLCSSEGPLVERLRETNIDVIVSKISGIRNPFEFIKKIFFLIDFIRKRDIHIVHTNGINVIASFVTRLTSAKLLIHFRTVHPLNRLDMVCLMFANRIITISEASRSQLLYLGYNASKITKIFNAVDLNDYDGVSDPYLIKKRFNIKMDKIVISVVGRIEPWKGIDYLIDALKDVSQMFPNILLLIVGDYEDNLEYYKTLKSQIIRINIEDYVRFTGFVEDIPSLMMATDILISPSLREAFGRVLIEGMAASRPVIATRVGGIPEVVIDGKTGILVESRNSAELVRAITKLIEEKDLRLRLGESGKNRAEQYFTIKTQIKEIEKVYEQLLLEDKT
ncbi:MAG: glycosyltransferase family 4 protein [Candidatus Scalinduaceae bacterium]